jgi:hypothetical protein
MSDIVPLRSNIQLQSTQFRSAVSEYLAQSLGQMNNFISYFQHSEKQFFLNGDYSLVSTPQTESDGLVVFEFNAQIIDVWLFNYVAGSAGTTQVDILVSQTAASANGGSGTASGSWTSIFTTKPSISFNASHPAWVGAVSPSLIGSQYSPSPSYSPPSNTVQPVLNASVTNLIPRWTAMRLDLITSQTHPQNCGALVHYRPV